MDEQRISREDRTGHHIAGAAVCVSRRSECRQGRGAKTQDLTVEQKLIRARDIAFGTAAIHDLCAGFILHERNTGNVVGMDVRFNREREGQSKLVDDSEVALDILKYGIDDDGLPRLPISHDVGSTFSPVVDILCFVDVQQDC